MKAKKWLGANYAQNSEAARIINELIKSLRFIREQKIQIFIINTDDVGGDQYLQEFLPKEYASLKDAGFLSTKMLKGADHSISPLASQELLLKLISEWMAEKF